MGMVFRLPQAPAAGATAAGTTRAEAAEGVEEADRLLREVAEAAALE